MSRLGAVPVTLWSREDCAKRQADIGSLLIVARTSFFRVFQDGTGAKREQMTFGFNPNRCWYSETRLWVPFPTRAWESRCRTRWTASCPGRRAPRGPPSWSSPYPSLPARARTAAGELSAAAGERQDGDARAQTAAAARTAVAREAPSFDPIPGWSPEKTKRG